jgi:hypothetical protein
MNGFDAHSSGAAWPVGGPGRLALSVLTMVLAGACGLKLLLAVSGGLFCSTIRDYSGANVATGGKIAFFAGMVGVLAALSARNRARLFGSMLVLDALALGAAIGFVARDSATIKQTLDCGFLGGDPSTSTHHVEYAYAMFGAAIVVLLTLGLRLLLRAPRSSSGS